MSLEGAAPPRLPSPGGEPLPSLRGYELLHEIASGGMATVYLGRKRGVGGFERLVAVKCCHPHLRRDPTFVSMFLDEARLAARIHHPNVVATLDVGDEDALYFVMEYVEGTSLAEWVGRLGPLGRRIPSNLLLRVMVDGLAGLHAAHELRDHDDKPFRLVHRDVSPQNILVGLDGVTRLVDFGIAKAESRATRTRTGQVKGKTGYMPPEQILGELLDRRADVYAAGVVLWEALTGRRLFDGESDAATINLVLGGKIPPPSSLSEALPVLDAVVLRALDFAPAERYPTAADFSAALRGAGLEIATPQSVGDAVSELFRAGVLLRRERAERRSVISTEPLPVRELSPSSESRNRAPVPAARGRLRLAPSRLGWIGIAVLLLAGGGVWGFRAWHAMDQDASPAASGSAAPHGHASSSHSAAMPSALGVLGSSRSETTVGELPTAQPTARGRPSRQPPAAYGSTLPVEQATPLASASPTPPPRASASPARLRAPPSEFRPPDL